MCSRGERRGRGGRCQNLTLIYKRRRIARSQGPREGNCLIGTDLRLIGNNQGSSGTLYIRITDKTKKFQVKKICQWRKDRRENIIGL